MADKLEFLSKLSGILELAKEYEYRLTKDQVEAYFLEDQLTSEQMELVFDYLMAQKVAVRGYIKLGSRDSEAISESKETETIADRLTQEEQEYLEEYETDLKAIRGAKDGEVELLAQKINEGDTLAKGRMTEIYLSKVVEIGKSMHHPELFLGDLIQEGNVSLMLALECLPDINTVGIIGVESHLETEIRQGIQLLIEEMTELKNRDKKMVEQVAELDECITKLTEDLGRKVTLDELALYTEMSEDEILEILKLTGEDVEEADASYEVKEGDLPEELK